MAEQCIDFDTVLEDNPDMGIHPADAMAHNLFGRAALDAIRLGECIRCAETVAPDAWPEAEGREYFITALCPTCWSVLFPEDDDE